MTLTEKRDELHTIIFLLEDDLARMGRANVAGRADRERELALHRGTLELVERRMATTPATHAEARSCVG